MNKHVVFLILHYITIKDTQKCIESIVNNFNNYNYDIVVVDNYSNNGSFEQLKNDYKEKSRVHLLCAKENLGFAKGNNIGFIYAKNVLKADFIIMINNDTFFEQKDFLKRVFNEYEKSGFAVLGPKIVLADNTVNPVSIQLPTIKKAKKQLSKIRLDYIINIFYLNGIFNFLKRLVKRDKLVSKTNVDKRYENIVLHGCALIFSKKYIDLFDGLNDKTFLYREEELLAIRLKKNGLLSVYNPDIIIRHNEDSSTNAITKNVRKKKIFVDKHLINSTKVLIKELENESEKI